MTGAGHGCSWGGLWYGPIAAQASGGKEGTIAPCLKSVVASGPPIMTRSATVAVRLQRRARDAGFTLWVNPLARWSRS